MDDNIKKLMKEIEDLEIQKKAVKEETDAKISEIVNKIMEYELAFNCMRHSSQSIEETREIGPGQKVTIRISNNGHIATAFLQKYSNKEKIYQLAALIEVFFGEGFDKAFKYEVRRSEGGSYNDIVLLAKEILKTVTEPNGPVEEILKDSMKNLENSIK